jgi:hypothetical protein
MRSFGFTAVACAALSVAGCNAGTGNDVARIDRNAPSYAQAHQTCWQGGIGMPTAATGAGTTRTQAYENCLQRQGWADAYAAWATE